MTTHLTPERADRVIRIGIIVCVVCFAISLLGLVYLGLQRAHDNEVTRNLAKATNERLARLEDDLDQRRAQRIAVDNAIRASVVEAARESRIQLCSLVYLLPDGKTAPYLKPIRDKLGCSTLPIPEPSVGGSPS